MTSYDDDDDMDDIQLFQFISHPVHVMAHEHILSGPEIEDIKLNTSLGRHLYQCLVNHGNKVALVSVQYF